MKKISAVKLTESAVMIALATILSYLKVVSMPFGGSVTAMSMLPIILIAYRWGTRWGLLTGFTYSLIQLLTDLSTLQYATSWYAAVAIILLDYVLAFIVAGLGGVFSKAVKDRTAALSLGATLACALRFICHVISGCTVWAGVSIPDAAGLTYSLSYNSSYMIPETILTVVGAYVMASAFDLKSTPMKRSVYSGKIGLLGIIAIALAVIADSIILFASIQNEEGYDITGIANANWLLIAIITLAAGALTLLSMWLENRKKA